MSHNRQRYFFIIGTSQRHVLPVKFIPHEHVFEVGQCGHGRAFLRYQRATHLKSQPVAHNSVQQPSPTNMRKRKAEQGSDATPLRAMRRRAPWKPENPRHLLLLTGRPCGGAFRRRTALPPLHDVPIGVRYRLTVEQAEACARDPCLRGDTPTVRLNGGSAPITWQDVIGECAFSSIFGPGVQVLTVAEICAGSPVWHSPASPDDEWNKTLLLPDGRTVGVCTAIASRGDEGQPLLVPLWAQQRQVHNFYVLMLIHPMLAMTTAALLTRVTAARVSLRCSRSALWR